MANNEAKNEKVENKEQKPAENNAETTANQVNGTESAEKGKKKKGGTGKKIGFAAGGALVLGAIILGVKKLLSGKSEDGNREPD